MNLFRLLTIVALALASAGCELAGNIFQAGMIVGIILVILLMAIVLWVARKVRRR